MFGWQKDRDPDAWTSDREQRAVLVAHFNGDVDKARLAWRRYTGDQFERFLREQGRIGSGDTGRDV